MLERLKPDTLRVLYRIAKVPGKGLTPFFTSPHNMIHLRNAVAKLEQSNNTGKRNDARKE